MKTGIKDIKTALTSLGSLVEKELGTAEASLKEAIQRLEELQGVGVLNQNQTLCLKDAVPQLKKALNQVSIALLDQKPVPPEMKPETPVTALGMAGSAQLAAAIKPKAPVGPDQTETV